MSHSPNLNFKKQIHLFIYHIHLFIYSFIIFVTRCIVVLVASLISNVSFSCWPLQQHNFVEYFYLTLFIQPAPYDKLIHYFEDFSGRDSETGYNTEHWGTEDILKSKLRIPQLRITKFQWWICSYICLLFWWHDFIR